MSHLYELERMRDWPAIVSSVPCPTCNALPGELCWEIHLSFGERKERKDFHVPRKLQAQYDWDHRNDLQEEAVTFSADVVNFSGTLNLGEPPITVTTTCGQPPESPTPSAPDPDTQALTAEQQPPEGSALLGDDEALPPLSDGWPSVSPEIDAERLDRREWVEPPKEAPYGDPNS